MQQVKIYTASPSDLSPPVQSESFCVDMVLASDYAELEAKCAAMSAKLSMINDLMEVADAFLAEVRASARNEGINYAASRLAAAFNHGFLNKPVSEVLDVTRMILSAKEDLSNDPLPAADGLSGEYAEKAIEEWATQLCKGAAL
ncbi:Eae protein [Salmonella enterica]|nr:Eae protein [Salmonella enterica]EBR1113766.1 Eae protein [Salmonella enterica]